VDSFRGVDPEDHLADGIARAKAYLEAGADCVYPIHLRTPEVLAAFVRGVGGAVNAPAWPGSPGLGGLAELGVARISLGGGLWQYARKHLEATLADVAAGKLPY
jgi:2-methylisocitrate lyase-like PEP mutase family enzyme